MVRRAKHKATPAEKTLERDFLVVMEKARSELHPSKADPLRIKQLRASQLPFCPANFFVQTATYGSLRFLDFSGMFHTSIGTAVHETFQTFLGMTSRFLANWECRHCGSHYKLTEKNTCCDSPMQYHEVEISIEGISGHIDAIFKDSKGRWWIIDFKTSSLKKLKGKKGSPGDAYILQIETYAYALWKQYGIKVKGVALPFIARDDPKEIEIYVREVDDKRLTTIGKRIARDVKRHKQVKSIETEEEALKLISYGHCGNFFCPTCKLKRDQKEAAISKAFQRGYKRGHVPINDLVKDLLKGRKPKLRSVSKDSAVNNKVSKIRKL